MFRNRYVISIWFFAMAMFMFTGATYGSHQDSLFSVNLADVILLMGSGAFVGMGILALFVGKIKTRWQAQSPDR
jgi:hypothetical protein